MQANIALEMLGNTSDGRVAEKTRARLRTASEIVGPSFSRVEAELARLAHVGVAPGTQAAAHLVDAGGKRVRPLSALLACACFGEVTAAAESCATAAELIHAATLLHDDVIDDGSERRGLPTSRRLWGNAVSVLAGDLLLVHALETVSRAGDAKTLAELFATLRALVDGEIVQLRGRTTLDLSLATYEEIVRGKTASLFSWALRAGARAGGAGEREVDRFGLFGEHVGVAFQVTDDLLDYAGDAAVLGKKMCADLLEGKITLPLIFAAELDPAIAPLVVRLRDGDASLAPEIAERVRGSGALERVRARAEMETASAASCLDEAPAGAARSLLLGVASELVVRAF